MNYNKTNLKRLITKANKMGIDISNIITKEIDKYKGKGIQSTIKKLQRAIERPKIVEESKKIDEKIKERKKERELKKQLKARGYKIPKGNLDKAIIQQFLNDKFLEEHPDFRQVFKFDTKHNKSGSAESTARSYMDARKKELKEKIFNQFPDVDPKLRDRLTKLINKVDFNLNLINDMELISENLFHKLDSDIADAEWDTIYSNYADDEYISRLIMRFSRLSRKANKN